MALVREVDVLFWEHDHQSDQTMIGEGKKVLFFFFFLLVLLLLLASAVNFSLFWRGKENLAEPLGFAFFLGRN